VTAKPCKDSKSYLEFRNLFSILAAKYPSFKPADMELSALSYWESLKQYSADVVLEAVNSAANNCPQFMPSAGFMIDLCEHLRTSKAQQPTGTIVVLCKSHHAEDLGIMERRIEKRPTIYLKMLCGCVQCHPEIWCPQCGKPLSKPDAVGNRECQYCGGRKQPEIRKGYWEQRAEVVAKQYPGKESFTRLVGEIKAHKGGFKPGSFGKAAAEVL